MRSILLLVLLSLVPSSSLALTIPITKLCSSSRSIIVKGIRLCCSSSSSSGSIEDGSIDTTIVAKNSNSDDVSTEVLAGLTVALATVPTSIAYATIVGLSPLLGIWTSIIIGGIMGVTLLITPNKQLSFKTTNGAGPGLICGAAGVVAIPLAKITSSSLSVYMGTTVILASLIEILLALLKTGKLINAVPEPVITGFLNTFALFLVQSQMKVFQYGGVFLPQSDLINAIVVALTCATSIKLLPKITKTIPAALGGLVVSTSLAKLLNLPVQTLADLAAKGSSGTNIFAGGLSSLPSISLPVVPHDMGVIQALLPVATGIALISIIETLLAAKIAARAQGGKESNIDPNQLMVGLGVGNAASSMIGGIGGCGLIPNTILNSSTGGKGPLSAISYSLALTVILLLFAPALGAIPMASLAGLMFTVAFNTFEWNETKAMLLHAYEERTKAVQNKQKYLDIVGLLVTMITCFYVDMGVGIISGVVITKGIDILDYFKRK